MDQQEQINAALREDVDSIKTTMGKLLELFQNLATKESTSQPERSAEWPELSLPKGYTLPEEESDPIQAPVVIPVTNGDPTPQGVSMGQEGISQPCHATNGVGGFVPKQSTVNANPDIEPARIVEEIEKHDLIKEVVKVKASMSTIREKFIGFKEFQDMHYECKICSANPDKCQEMRDCLQKLMDQGLVQIGYSRTDADVSVLESRDQAPIEIPYSRKGLQIPVKSVDPIVFCVPAPFPFESANRALEVATVVTTKLKHSHRQKTGSAMYSWKAMKEALEEGSLEGWGKLPDIPEKKNRFGLGYVPSTTMFSKASQNHLGLGRIPSIQETFHSAGFDHEDHVASLEDTDEEVPDLVCHCAPDEILANWKVVVIPEIISISKSINRPIDNDTSITPYNFEFPINQAEEGDEEDCEFPEGLARLLKQEEEVIQPHQESVEVINLGNKEDKKEIKVGAFLKMNVKEKLVELLKEYVDVFAWSYQDMPGLDTDIVMHRLPLKPECAPVKQKMRRTRPDMALKIREEVKKQFDAGFLAVAKYPQWVANIVPVPKKDGKVRMCVDYRDLNRASPKDDFPLPHIDVLVDNTAQFSVFSFMDGFSGYNQIKMAPEDMEKTTFITPWGTFCYKVMPFGLKNAGATYQRAMVTLFHDMIHKEIEVYVDDMIAKSQTEEDHLVHLQKLFERLRKFKLRLNPNKCTFGTRSGKLLGFVVSQRGIEVDPDKVRAIQNMSAPRTEKESRYTSLEKTCCALAWAARRLRQYMLSHTTWLISKMDPIKYIFEKPALTGKIAQYQPIRFDFPDEDIMALNNEEVIGGDEGPEPGGRWKLAFDGASNAMGHGIGAVLISPRDGYTPFTARLCFDCTNNVAEYEACIMGLEAAISLRIKILEVYGDSALVIYQVKGEWETRHPKLIPYRAHVVKLMEYFDEITFHHIPREENQVADALATLSSMYKVRFWNEAPLIKVDRKDEPVVCMMVEEKHDDKPWFYDIKCYIEKCVDKREADLLVKEIHEGAFGTHANGHTMAKKILRAGYYWLTMEADCFRYAKTCHKCQIYADKVHVPPTPLNVLTAPWPFSMWGIDMIGMIEPKASNGHRFILVAIDYFTKWVEAASYANVTKQVVARFIKKEIICRYGIPSKIITDNGSNLNNNTMKELCEEFKIEHHNSSPYRPKMNGAVEAANKNIKKIVQKMVKTYKDWHEMLPFALHGYRTAVRTSTGATPFSLVYGMEAVLPIEVEIPSLRVLMETKLEEAEWVQARFDQLNLIEEKRLTALCHGQLYQKRLKRAFDKKVRPREFREGDLVLRKILPIHRDPRGKWTPNYEGPYVVKKAFSGGALIITTMDVLE
ncbi:unnamed protein product [Trifolium pratense]|uniref:Uncharacterized protein n=1 Tax=Trifolium pratense TaxID=57577 RepID=A0ACB0K5P5_TRIPR|nr:unnamed protein product [Trifolium pratense]